LLVIGAFATTKLSRDEYIYLQQHDADKVFAAESCDASLQYADGRRSKS